MSGINGAVEGDALEQWQPGLQDACHFVNLFTRSGFYLFGFNPYSTKHINRSLEDFLHVLQATLISVSVWLQICVECVATEVLLVLHHHSSFQAQLEMMVKKVKQETVEFK